MVKVWNMVKSGKFPWNCHEYPPLLLQRRRLRLLAQAISLQGPQFAHFSVFFSFLSFVCGGINLVTGSVHFRVGSNMRWMGSIWIIMDLYGSILHGLSESYCGFQSGASSIFWQTWTRLNTCWSEVKLGTCSFINDGIVIMIQMV
jgi:hypothetical protein